MLCGLCGEETPRVASCGAANCAAAVGGCCMSQSGLCLECDADERRAFVSDPLVAILLSGAMIGGQRMPLCSVSGEPAEECRHMEVDDVA